MISQVPELPRIFGDFHVRSPLGEVVGAGDSVAGRCGAVGAKECSPGREPWVKYLSNAPPGLLDCMGTSCLQGLTTVNRAE